MSNKKVPEAVREAYWKGATFMLQSAEELVATGDMGHFLTLIETRAIVRGAMSSLDATYGITSNH